MRTTLMSGPADTVREARDLLGHAGYTVLDRAVTMGLELAGGEEFLSVAGGHSHVASVVEHLGWRHRATVGSLQPAMPVVAMEDPLAWLASLEERVAALEARRPELDAKGQG